MKRRWKPPYRPCERFMQHGGTFGRCRKYPWIILRTRHVFTTCIHIRVDRRELNLASENVKAFGRHIMVPMFAYQWRPTRRLPPPRPRKRVVDLAVPHREWRQAA